MTQKYTPLFEMAFKPSDFEANVVDPRIMNIYKHFIKYRLSVDKSFCNNFDKNLYNFISKKKLKDYWKKEIHIFISSLMKDIKDVNIKKGYKDTKEKIYISSVENNLILLSSKNQDIKSIKQATSEYKNNKEVEKNVKYFFKFNSVREIDWMIDVYKFLISIKPIKNEVRTIEEIDKLFNNFIDIFNLTARRK